MTSNVNVYKLLKSSHKALFINSFFRYPNPNFINGNPTTSNFASTNRQSIRQLASQALHTVCERYICMIDPREFFFYPPSANFTFNRHMVFLLESRDVSSSGYCEIDVLPSATVCRSLDRIE